jgi:hypothetical protein
VLLGTLLHSRGRDTHHRKHCLYCYVTRGTTSSQLLCYVTEIHRNTCHVISTNCCMTSPAHALYSNGPYADTKETLPQYCSMAHALERAPQAAAQQCLEQIRHNILQLFHDTTCPAQFMALDLVTLIMYVTHITYRFKQRAFLKWFRKYLLQMYANTRYSIRGEYSRCRPRRY